ncbi:hypothetical protein TNIN_377071, partial [Trichonephila inaurata madagascariensis]
VKRNPLLSYQFRIAQNTISGIIPVVCSAIYHHLGQKSKSLNPKMSGRWSQKNLESGNFPLCLGMDL